MRKTAMRWGGSASRDDAADLRYAMVLLCDDLSYAMTLLCEDFGHAPGFWELPPC